MCTLTIVVLLFGYHTSTSSRAVRGQTSFISGAQAGLPAISPPAATAAATVVPSTAGTSTSPTPGAATAAGSASVATTNASTTTKAASRRITGHVLDTRWGPVQVQATVVNGRIISVAVVQYPNGNPRDQAINARALPILVQETLTAQSADIDMVSGATVTSEGYLRSLQSILDQM